MKTLIFIFLTLNFFNGFSQTLKVKLNDGGTYSTDTNTYTATKPQNIDDDFVIGGLMTKNYLIATYNDRLVYLRYEDIRNSPPFKHFWDKYYINPTLKATEKADNERLKPFIEQYGKPWGQLVAAGSVVVGMTEEMVVASIGKPLRVTVSKTGDITGAMWVYPNSKYLFFTNGRVSGWDKPVDK